MSKIVRPTLCQQGRHWPQLSHCLQGPRRRSDRPDFERCHSDNITWKHFPSYSPFVRGIQRSSVNSPHKGQWRGALMFSLICAWTYVWVNDRDAGDLRRHRSHCDVIIMVICYPMVSILQHATEFVTIWHTLQVACLKKHTGWIGIESTWARCGMLPNALRNLLQRGPAFK